MLEGSGVGQASSLCNVDMTVESKMETVKRFLVKRYEKNLCGSEY